MTPAARRRAFGVHFFMALAIATPTPGRAQHRDPALPGSSLKVFLMTMGPGADIYERFGHNAIWIHDSLSGQDLVYNYGTFDFQQPHFVSNFVMGRPQYWLGVSTMGETMATYTYFKRDLQIQELNLLPAQRRELADRLATNALPANRVYTYDYFRDNCSTRVRDMLDAVLGGALRRATEGKPAEGSLRFHTLRSITNDKLMFLGIDAGLGPSTDRAIDQWQEMFLPAKVQDRVRELRVPGPDGREIPLVAGEGRLIDLGAYHVDPAPPHWDAGFLGVAVLLTLLIGTASLPGRRGVAGRVAASTWLALVGVGGVVLLFLWFGTNHVATHGNRNLLLLSPVALLLIPAPWRRGLAWQPTMLVGVLLVGSVALGGLLALVPAVGIQHNLPIAELAGLPTFTAAVASMRVAVSRRRAAALPPPPPAPEQP